LGREAVPELITSQVEAVSPVCRTLAEVRAELLRLRREVSEVAATEGSRIAAASTHPFSHWREQQTTPKERYKGIMESYQRLAWEQVAFGLHVHVGLDDREAAVRVMNRLRIWLAPILALSANSPFWLAPTPATPVTTRRSGAACRYRGRQQPSSRLPNTMPWWRLWWPRVS
jgi:carboxylate-amine ligase